MKKLPLNDRDLNKIVFKNAGVSEPRSLIDYFSNDDINYMLDHGNFSCATRDWLYNAFDYYLTKAGY